MTITAIALDDDVIAGLLAAQQDEMASYYGGEGGSGAPPRGEEFLPPAGVFLAARRDGEIIGCGGICRLDEGVAELRRMYVAPAARGLGIGRQLLAALESAAVELGYSSIRLETGFRQREAIGLYESAGFRRGDCWGPYLSDPKSVCYEKPLGHFSQSPTS
ncbi:MAG TPA: GNAT family N-acetyltransferase [Gaiellales bacterium]|nr:GNAT family N-acetyltransferase [Gaiellales bacterium]